MIVPHALWKATGDTSFFTDHWPAMTRFMEARKAHDPELKGSAFGAPWGDWLNLNDPTPHAYVELAYFTMSSLMMAEMAEAQGLADEAQKYRGWVETMRANFRKQYLQPDGTIQPESQSAYVLALDCGLLTDPAERKKAGDRLAALIREKAGPKNTGMTTGFLGTKPLLPVLTDTGHLDLAVSMLQSRQYPSWGYEVKNGATTIWERWNSYTEEHGFGGADGKMNAAMNSFSHYSFGAVTEWMMTTLAGIAPAEPGYSKIRLHPHFPSANATIRNGNHFLDQGAPRLAPRPHLRAVGNARTTARCSTKPPSRPTPPPNSPCRSARRGAGLTPAVKPAPSCRARTGLRCGREASARFRFRKPISARKLVPRPETPRHSKSAPGPCSPESSDREQGWWTRRHSLGHRRR